MLLGNNYRNKLHMKTVSQKKKIKKKIKAFTCNGSNWLQVPDRRKE